MGIIRIPHDAYGFNSNRLRSSASAFAGAQRRCTGKQDLIQGVQARVTKCSKHNEKAAHKPHHKVLHKGKKAHANSRKKPTSGRDGFCLQEGGSTTQCRGPFVDRKTGQGSS